MAGLPNCTPEFGTVEWALDQPVRSPGAKLLLAVLAREGATLGVVITVERLAEKASISRSAVGRNLRYLEDRGWVSRARGPHCPNTFTLCATAQLSTADVKAVEQRFTHLQSTVNSKMLTAA